MTRVGWLADPCTYVGGAERTQAEFKAAAPEGVEVVDCPPGQVDKTCDRYAIHNCLLYEPEELSFDVPAWKYWHDVGPYISKAQHEALAKATLICVSPLQRAYMGLDAVLIPPSPPLERFREAAASSNGNRTGAVAVARNWWLDKGPVEVEKWAEGNGGVDFYGEGRDGAELVDYEELPNVLARYKTFVHLPRVIDPCPRTPIEAWAAGLSLVVNRNVGSLHWIQNEPEKLESAREDFWRLVLNDERN